MASFTMDNTSTISHKIKVKRKQMGITQEELARKADIPYTTLVKIETGAVKSPSVDTVNKIACALDTTIDELIVNINMKKRKPSVVSLFSGCGGMDLGFYLEGFNVVWANDYNHEACNTYKQFFGDHIVEGDINKVDIKSIPRNADVVIGGFPCQDFSMLWKRGGITTERGNLFKSFSKIVEHVNPKVFVAENVKGILTANDGKAIKSIVEEFSKINGGYKVSVNLINFADYGVSQLRERVLIIGVKNSLNHEFKKPKPTHVGKHVSSKEALKGVEKVPYNNEHQNIAHGTIEKLKIIPPGGNFTDIPKNSPHYVKGMISHVYRRLHPDKPSTTIIASGGGGTWGYHFSEPRPLTNRERARLFGYPDDFVFTGSMTEARRQIGNSVPPAGIRPWAKAIKKFLID